MSEEDVDSVYSRVLYYSLTSWGLPNLYTLSDNDRFNIQSHAHRGDPLDIADKVTTTRLSART